MALFNQTGGKSPHTNGFQITVTCPDATRTNPVRTGDVLRFFADGTPEYPPYVVTKLQAGLFIQCIALHSVYDTKTSLAVQVIGFNRIEKFNYSGNLKIFDTVVSDGTGKARRNPTAGDTYVIGNVVMKVDEVNKICEVLIR